MELEGNTQILAEDYAQKSPGTPATYLTILKADKLKGPKDGTRLAKRVPCVGPWTGLAGCSFASHFWRMYLLPPEVTSVNLAAFQKETTTTTIIIIITTRVPGFNL